MKVNQVGFNQILSNEYNGALPQKIYIQSDNEPLFINSKKEVFIENINEIIIIEFNSFLTNFSYMFNNLTSITSIKMNNLIGYKSNMSYMFNNCINL